MGLVKLHESGLGASLALARLNKYEETLVIFKLTQENFDRVQ
jgi:hypothetical protein